MGIIRTNKFLNAVETKALHGMAVDAANTPAIVLSQRHLGPAGKDEATLAQERFHRALDKAVVAAGFPEPAKDEDGDAVHYGLDFKTGEILEWDGKA